nr:MAG: hypothetical protein [brine shrimp partiti-like virus 3]
MSNKQGDKYRNSSNSDYENSVSDSSASREKSNWRGKPRGGKQRGYRPPHPTPMRVPPMRGPAPPELPPPEALHLNKNPVVKNEPLWKDAIFGPDICVRENSPRTRVHPAATGFIPLVEDSYRYLVKADSRLQRELVPEAYRYYCVSLLWLRLLSIKRHNGDNLTFIEDQFLTILDRLDLVVPEPISLYLRGIGNINTPNGEHLYPLIPDLPVQLVNGFGGYPEQAVGNQDVTPWIDFPSLGICAEAIRSRMTPANVGPWVPAVTPAGRQVTSNLAGYVPHGSIRHEALNSLFALGITDQVFPTTQGDSGLYVNLIQQVSIQVRENPAFRMLPERVDSYDKGGCYAQAIPLRPTYPHDAGAGPYINGRFESTSLNKVSVAEFGVAHAFGYSVLRQPDPAGGVGANNVWAPFTSTRANPCPDGWIARRNTRFYSLPVRFRATVFTSIAHETRDRRDLVLRSLYKKI